LDRELGKVNDGIRLALDAAGRDEGARGRMADLQDRLRKGEQRAMEIREEMAALEGEQVDEREMAAALRLFDPVWDSLAPREQARVAQLLVERVAFDGRDGTISLTFRPTGIKTLAAEMASREEVAV
jgi:site-specific DNA recombinase